jgi:hypothetical protein
MQQAILCIQSFFKQFYFVQLQYKNECIKLKWKFTTSKVAAKDQMMKHVCEI